MTARAKAVIILGLQEPGNTDIELVQSLGYQTLLFKSDVTLQDALSADLPVEINLNDEDAVIEKAQALQEKYDICAVFSLNEYRIALAARIKEALQLPNGLPYQAALNCRNKKLTRQRLAEHGVGSAQFTLVRTPEEAMAAMDRFTWPVVIKPSNEAGSILVTICHTNEELCAAVEAIRTHSENWVGQTLDREILMEEYLSGPEYSVEACTIKGTTTVFAVTAKQTHKSFEVGHLVPAPLPEADVQAIHQVVHDALKALGVDDAVTHTEVKLTPAGPRIIEVNARPGGDRIHLLVLAVTGYNLRELSLHVALGGTLENAPRHAVQAPSAAIRFFMSEAAGTVSIQNTAEVQAMPEVQDLHLLVKNGDRVEPTTHNFDRLGHVIVHGDQDRNAQEVVEATLTRLQITVDPLAALQS